MQPDYHQIVHKLAYHNFRHILIRQRLSNIATKWMLLFKMNAL